MDWGGAVYDVGHSRIFSPGGSRYQRLSRTQCAPYVHYRGVPGVWFFSLDAANRLAVWGARAFYHLPYFNARMSLKQQGNRIDYNSTRVDGRGAPADLQATWTIGAQLPRAEPGSLEFFLTERYCLYSSHRERLFRSRIFHPPWPLQTAHVESSQSTMISSLGIQQPDGVPLLHYAESIKVDIWPLRRVRTGRGSDHLID